jgi:signal recognition particle subunit SRP54
MTPRERALPHVIDGSRRQRIARGSGSSVQQVNQLLLARKEMEKVMKQMGKGKMPNLAQLQNGAQAQQPAAQGRPKPSATRKSKNKRKKRSRR